MAVQYCNYDIKGTLAVTGTSTLTGAVTTGGDLTIGGTGGVFIPEYIYHRGDTNSFFGFSSNDHFKVNTSGATALTIDSSRNATFTGYVTSTGLTVDYTGNRTGDAGILVTNDSNDWGIKVDKDPSGDDYGILSQTDGDNAIVVRNSAGTQKITLRGNGSATFTGQVSGITPSAAANFTTKAYVDGLTPGAGVFLPLAGGTMTGVAGVVFPDAFKLNLGTGSDLEIYHNGLSGNNNIDNINGDLYMSQYANDKDIIFRSDNGSGGVENYIQIDGSEGRTTFNKSIRLNDSVQLQIGSSNDAYIMHNGTHTYFVNGVGNLEITNDTNDGDIIFKSDNGSGGVEPYMTLNGTNRSIVVTAALGVYHNDGIASRFGDAGDLQIYHNATNSIISNGTGNLYIKTTGADKDIVFEADDGSGGTVAEYFRLDGGSTMNVFSKPTWHGDGVKSFYGNSQDLEIYHSGSHSYIKDTGAGSLYLQTNGSAIYLQDTDGNAMAQFTDGGGSFLFYNGNLKFETENTGVAVRGSLSTTEDISVSGDLMVTGTTTAGGTLICEGNITVQDSDKLQLGNSQDLELYHASGVSYIDNDTGHLYIRNNVDNDDGGNIYIQAKSGENSILCQDDGAVGLYNNNVQMFSTNSTGAGAYGYIGFGSAGTSTGSSYGFRYGSSSPSGSQGIVITVSDTGGAYFDGVGRFQNTNTGQGAGMFQMVNYGSLYGRYMQFFRGSTSNIIGYIGYNSSNTSVTFSTTNSDIRTKKNITTWDENVLDKFKALQPKRFDFKVAIGDKGAVKERGFIAQYEKDNFPEAYQLNGNDEKATYGFHPMEMVPYMMKAIKDLTIKNEELERRIKTLES